MPKCVRDFSFPKKCSQVPLTATSKFQQASLSERKPKELPLQRPQTPETENLEPSTSQPRDFFPAGCTVAQVAVLELSELFLSQVIRGMRSRVSQALSNLIPA